jgi:hypothetical protein
LNSKSIRTISGNKIAFRLKVEVANSSWESLSGVKSDNASHRSASFWQSCICRRLSSGGVAESLSSVSLSRVRRTLGSGSVEQSLVGITLSGCGI